MSRFFVLLGPPTSAAVSLVGLHGQSFPQKHRSLEVSASLTLEQFVNLEGNFYIMLPSISLTCGKLVHFAIFFP